LRDALASDNSNSLVLAVDGFGRRILLTGDLEASGLEDLLAEEPLRCDVLMAPHHGSRQSNSPELAAWCRPRWVVFSGDGRWNVPEINATYQAVGSRVLHTYQSGAIQVRIVAGEIAVSGFVNP
jgi:competence protein ComEC